MDLCQRTTDGFVRNHSQLQYKLNGPALGCILLAIAMLSTRYVHLHWFLSLVAGTAVYIAALSAFGAFTDGELRV